ncbi:MAG: sigma-70 family RNA polymerase sigma factor [Candidatus Eisenbacteria bacterium]|uniref:Sigma-70 family RNA polymerase sigma factor n=1 Tax=Eiseniibacteriota bacterium TaxID=2212470 RepID=A0A7Y2E8E6_UNCEI|nr:sigma-70 family RNA polymerase sigma factor [Candidatus Eisenbacteria bacterium]
MRYNSVMKHDAPDLLKQALSGDEAAWTDLVARYQRLVYSVISDFRLPVEDGEDVFQEVFLRVHRYGHRIEDSSRLIQWILVTTRRLCIDRYQRGAREKNLPSDVLLPSNAPSPSQGVESQERAYWVHATLEQLNERCRSLLTLLFLTENVPEYREVAEELGVAEGSVGPMRSRCMEAMFQILVREGFWEKEN